MLTLAKCYFSQIIWSVRAANAVLYVITKD